MAHPGWDAPLQPPLSVLVVAQLVYEMYVSLGQALGPFRYVLKRGTPARVRAGVDV